jgi:FK506-binding protein 1
MGVDKQVLRSGNGVDFPKKHDEVSMEYTGNTPSHNPCQEVVLPRALGWLYDDGASDKKGTQ